NSYTTHEDFVIAVKNYTKNLGFQVRLEKVKKKSTGEICKRTILYSKKGASEKTNNIRNRPSKHCNCHLLVCAFFNSNNGFWYIIATYLEHNHSMVLPNLQWLMTCERTIPSEGTIKKQKLDANDFIKELENIKSQDNKFQYKVRINSETNKLQQAIWMFHNQRVNYCQFYDDVVFDNTYKTNRFNMPFGIFTGVNNYGQSVCFAGTIMCNESTDSFI
ncbi:12387_t:CDS:2, partial [Funneliformis geosporum]